MGRPLIATCLLPVPVPGDRVKVGEDDAIGEREEPKPGASFLVMIDVPRGMDQRYDLYPLIQGHIIKNQKPKGLGIDLSLAVVHCVCYYKGLSGVMDYCRIN